MKFFVAVGLVLGFAYEFGMTWYVTWSPQAQAHRHPMVGPDVVVMSGFMGAFWGGLLAAAAGAVSRRLRERHRVSMERLMRQAEEASAVEQGVWPPPPNDRMVKRGTRDDSHT